MRCSGRDERILIRLCDASAARGPLSG